MRNRQTRKALLTLGLTGSMLLSGHCEATVKKALESLDGVTGAPVSREKGNAIVESASDVSNDVLKEAVEAKDYKVLEIQ
ncbi:MAG: heavy-metal-associated domain-containing protein [Lachnospiraceae bacterium]|nr:heavy-metal-associated domain-containing protein [Lachnospiraceae bacterium]